MAQSRAAEGSAGATGTPAGESPAQTADRVAKL